MKQKRNKTGRRLFSFLLALVLVVSNFTGIVPGMSLTAYAAGEKAYAAYDVTTETNMTKSGDALTALQVTFNERQWYIIEDKSSSATSGTVTLLSADTSFGTEKFADNDSNKYSTSQVKAYLDSMTETNGAFAGVAEAIETVNLTTNKYASTEEYETVNGVKLYLLSTEEANSLPENVREAGFTGGDCGYNEWWLRSPGDPDGCYAACVFGDEGYVDAYGYNVDNAFGVRPTLKLNLSSVIFSSVNLSGGANAAISGGTATQNYFDMGNTRGAMTTVTYTAKTGYKFPETSELYKETNGITVAVSQDQKTITVSGTPTKDTEITIPDAVAATTTLQSISKTTTWNFSDVTYSESGEFRLTEENGKNIETVYADFEQLTFEETFNANAIAFKGEFPIRSNSNKYCQDGTLRFNTTVPGTITVKFSDTGTSASATAVKRYLVVNGEQTEYWTSRENNSDDFAYAAKLNVTSGEISVPAGDVTITGSSAITISSVTFTALFDKTELVNAITEAETYYNSIKDNNDYTDIASTLKTAIDDAKEVADSDTADQDAVDAATTDITTAKTNADAAKKDIDDTTEANKVSDKISELPSKDAVKKDDKTAIDAAKAAFDELTDDQKAKVSDADKQKLNDAVEALAAIEKEEAAAKAVSDKIAALPAKDAVTKDDKDAINAAKKAFDALTDDQKKKVSDADKQKLSDAVAAIEAIEKDEADAEAAQTVSDKIAALPVKDAVTKDDKAAINAARKAFDALTDDQKKMVSEADRQKLDDAVAALAAIDGEGNTPTPTPVPVANVSGNDTVSTKKLELNIKGTQTLGVGGEATIKAAVAGKGSDASLNSVNWVAPSGSVIDTEVQADGSLKIKAVGPGTAFVTAVCGGKTKTVKYNVKQPVNKAEASLNAIALSVKEKYRICVNLDAATTDKFFYATNDKKVCTVNGKGIIAAKGEGSTTVDILAGEKKKTAKKVASVTVTVKNGAAAAVEVKDVSINYVGNKTLFTGEMAYISTLVNGGLGNGGQAVKYSFSTKGIVKIDAYGRLTAKKAGKVIVTATCGGKTDTVELTVKQPLKVFKVNKTYVKVKQGKAKTVTLSVKTTPALNKSDIKAVWSVANEGNGVKKISDENGKAVFEVSAAAKDTVVTATVTDPVTGRTYTVNSVIDVN